MKKLTPLFAWLKEAAGYIVLLIGCFLLICLAIVLVVISSVASVIWYFATIRSKKREAREILTRTSNFFFLIALSLDHLGNVLCGGFFNWLLLKGDSVFPFGVPGQSVSEILGWNFAIDNLNERGLNFRHDLNTIDPDHCENAMMSAVYDARHILEKYKGIQSQINTIEHTQEFLAKYN